MKPARDLYNYKDRLERILHKLDTAPISQSNKELISLFNRTCFLEGLSIPRRLKLIGGLIMLAQDYIKKDFDKVTKQDLKDAVMRIDSVDHYSPWTKHSYKVIIKKFYKWLKFGDEYRTKIEYPELVSWLRCTLKRKDQPKIKVSDILTEEEIKKLIDAAENPRDRAFISMLYELGARIRGDRRAVD